MLDGLRHDSKRTFNIFNIFNALLGKMNARLSRQVGINEFQVEVLVNR